MSSKILEFKLGKGLTTKVGEMDFTKKYFELTVQLTEQCTEQGFQAAVARAELLIDGYLVQPETPQIPNIDTEDLMNHKGWKGKKLGEGQYAEGSLSWGWDFADKFKPETIKALEKGPMAIGENEFTFNGTIVSAHKLKEK